MSTPRDRTVPPKANPEEGENPGYAEDRPRDKQDVDLPHGYDDPPSPEEGGLDRDPDADDDAPPDAADAPDRG